MKIIMAGAGNVAFSLAPALKSAGHDVAVVWSRTPESANRLANVINAESATSLASLPDADMFLLSVRDAVLPDVARQLASRHSEALFVHTAGSMPLDVYGGKAKRLGVLYPMQTFSCGRKVDVSCVPFFIEGSDESVAHTLCSLCDSLGAKSYVMDSDRRGLMHLAAVFANNFANQCFAEAELICRKADIPFSALLPLIEETVRKIHQMPPAEAQTGPAVRADGNVIERHLDMLSADAVAQDIYRALSRGIRRTALRRADENDKSKKQL